MKKPVDDSLVAEYTKRLRAGGPLGDVFPCRLSECDFTEAQRIEIREAQKARKKLLKESKPQPPTIPQPKTKTVALKPAAVPPSQPKVVAAKPVAPVRARATKSQSLSMLEKMLYPVTLKPVTPVQAPAPRPRSLTKLERILYLQQSKCFFCGEKLALADANIEHLHPLSKGGTRTEDNEVVCHKSLNDTFGNLPLKRKFEFVLRSAGAFLCPKK